MVQKMYHTNFPSTNTNYLTILAGYIQTFLDDLGSFMIILRFWGHKQIKYVSSRFM